MDTFHIQGILPHLLFLDTLYWLSVDRERVTEFGKKTDMGGNLCWCKNSSSKTRELRSEDNIQVMHPSWSETMNQWIHISKMSDPSPPAARHCVRGVPDYILNYTLPYILYQTIPQSGGLQIIPYIGPIPYLAPYILKGMFFQPIISRAQQIGFFSISGGFGLGI